MDKPMIIQDSIIIKASATQVWDVLINPEKTKLYMYGCKALTDWTPGSMVEWEAESEGRKVVYVTGKVVEYQPHHILRYTVFDPNKNMKDIPTNHLQVTYQLITIGDQTKLTVTQDGFEGAEAGEERYKEVYNNGAGWSPILQQIAAIAEDP